jgi:hypothetical protein
VALKILPHHVVKTLNNYDGGLEVVRRWLMQGEGWMLMQGLYLASEPHALITKHLVMDPAIQYAVNPPELASVAASLSQYGNSSTHKVACASPLDSVALSATVSITK